MIRLTLGAAATAATLACATAGAGRPGSHAAVVAELDANAFRRQVPEPGKTPQVQAPVPTQATLDNGLAVWTVAKRGLPLVSLNAVIRSGSAQDPPALPGLASFAAEIMRQGTTSRDAAALAEAIEARGASLEVDVGEDSLALTVTALVTHLDPLMAVLADILQHPSLPSGEIERLRRQRAAALAQRQDSPQVAAAELFRKSIYGDHPYAHLPLGTLAANAKVDRAALANFIAAHVRPANAAIVIVGDVDAETARTTVARHLGGWRGHAGVQAPPAAPTPQRPEVVLLPRPGAPQSQVMVGTLGASRADPRYFPMVLGNAVFGGLFNSRINMNLREDKGYTYGAHSAFEFMRAQGPWSTSSSIRTDATEPALHEIFHELAGMRDAEVGADELAAAKSRYALSLPNNFQTVGHIAAMMGTIYVFDLPADYYRQLPARLDAVTAGDIRAVAADIFRAEPQTIVVVGDRERVLPGLEDLHRGPVRVERAAAP